MSSIHSFQREVDDTRGSRLGRRRRGSRIGRLACALAAVTGLLAVIAAEVSAQGTTEPTLNARCGLKVMLVLDESQSIAAGGFVSVVRDAANGFVTALEDTGSPLAVTAFQSYGRAGPPETSNPAVGYSEVTHANVSMFTNWVGTGSGAPATAGGYNPPTSASTNNTNANSPNGTTNWQDAFQQVRRTPGGLPNLVVFVTDGNPNTVGSPPRPATATAGPTNGTGRVRYISDTNTTGGGRDQATSVAVPVANALKADGVKIFGIGVGPDVQDSISAGRLASVTGPVEGTNPLTADYALVANFADLRAELAGIVASVCGSSLTIHKLVSEHGGPWMPAADWHFTADLTSPGHTWLEPPTAGSGDHAELPTGPDGSARFFWRLPSADTTAHLGVTHETVKEGFDLVQSVCETHNLDGDLLDSTVTKTIPAATLGREEYRTCYVYNAREAPGGGGGDETDVVEPEDAPHLVTEKHMPPQATVGEHVPITITVHNHGTGPAHDVIVTEEPPDGGHIVAVGEHGTIEANGTVVWRVPTLEPGETKTLHATMLVTHTGRLLNTVVSEAADGDPSVDNVPIRVRPATRPTPRPPVFTG